MSGHQIPPRHDDCRRNLGSLRADSIQEINLNHNECENQKGLPQTMVNTPIFQVRSLRHREFAWLACGSAVLGEIC